MTVWIIGKDERAHKEMLQDIDSAPEGARVTLDASPKRTLPQNRLMWKMIHCFATQIPIGGEYRTDKAWKCVLLKGFGKAIEFVPDLDGGIVCIGYSSSALRKEEMANFIEYMHSEGALRGVKFYDGHDDDSVEEAFEAQP